ncbi:hypothetical protein QGP82_04175 [Leptothoe sp. LEGE 181152]|nr:hypothetical protein [Leptothoe sp. LEGE 181152]
MEITTEAPSSTMTEADWATAHKIAQNLINQKTDVNELGKAIAYLRNAINQKQPDAGTRFFDYLKTLVNQGRSIGHSGRTLDYYRSIEKNCSDYLQDYQFKPKAMLYTLGWVARLMRYYKEGGTFDENLTAGATLSSAPPESARQAELREIAQTQNYEVGQQVTAEVKAKKKGNAVTYELEGGIKLTVKEPKRYNSLEIGQAVKVEVLELRDTGIPKKIKYTG